MTDFNILILAAGAGRRMGREKQLIPFQGKTFIAHTIEKALSLGAVKVYVVLGAYMEKLKTLVSAYPVDIIENKDWPEGMGCSLAAGAVHILSQSHKDHGLLILLIDQPRIMTDPNYLPDMIRRWWENPERMVATSYEDHFGVPCLFPARLVPRLIDCKGDRGARAILNAEGIDVFGLDAGKLHIDFDTESDLLGLNY